MPPPAQAFFLPASCGQRLCLYHPANPDVACQGAFIYVHPFAEEMNLSRRMAAMQAKMMAAMGYAVLQIDLFGCGDSSGEFREARWQIWKDDIALAKTWLQTRVSVPVGLWGLRLGALLVLDVAHSSPDPIETLVLWQPVLHGETFLTQFLRLRLANQMVHESGEKSAEKFGEKSGEKAAGTSALRQALLAGEVLEIAGYEIAPELAASIDALDVAALAPANSKVHWIDVAPDANRPMAPAAARVVSVWEQVGIDLRLRRVSCPPFWSAPGIVACPELMQQTVAGLASKAGFHA